MDHNCPVHAGQHTLNDNTFTKFFCLCSGPLKIVEQRARAEDPVYTRPQPDLPGPPFPIQGTIRPPVTITNIRFQCPFCPNSFPRRQERDKHELTHVPYFMHCPLQHCPWRGNRAELFKKHWQQEDHRPYHGYYGHNPEGNLIKTYDPSVVLNQIKSGAITLREGEDQAIVMVQLKAYELNKANIWTDPWGRVRK